MGTLGIKWRRSLSVSKNRILNYKPIMFKILTCFILLLPVGCFAQFTISGRVLNQADTKPVANASVFLSNATIGGKTANDGAFILHNAKPGKYELVVSIIGFEAYHQTVIVDNSNITLPDITISPKTIALAEVTVLAKPDPDRGHNLELFEKEFLGTSYLAKECKILNPDMLDLNYDENTRTLTASSVDFLLIENNALGYKIKYLLNNFLMDYDNNARKLHFEGSALFEELKGEPSEERRWQKRREQVYEGSAMHFLRSALENRVDEEGFRVLQLTTSPNPQKDKLPKTIQTLMYFPLNAKEIIKPTDQQGIYALGCENDALHIAYNKNHHFPKTGQLAHLDDPDNTETTILNFNAPYVFFDRNGGVIDPNSLSFTGAWGNDRVAELLPVDYEPPQGKNIVSQAAALNLLTTVQHSPLADSLLKITSAADSSIKNRPAEKLYLQFDKPYYAIGDTIWFKAYLFHAPTMSLSAKSGIMYVDVFNDSTTFIKQYRLPVKEGLSWGNISLSDFPAGNYTVRAYTTWMRNFDPNGFFYKRFMVADDHEQTWLANSETTSGIVNGKLQANVKLLLTDMDKTAIADNSLQLQVMAGNHHLYKQQVQTDAKGMLDVNFIVPDKASGLNLVAENKQSGNKITIPINLNRAEHTDIQFLPEGGNLVSGLPAHIGFKAIGEDGKGITISGDILDHNQKQVASFSALHNGMGSFDLTVNPGETYMAKVTLPGGIVKEYPLPMAKSTGAVLNVTNPFDKDSVTVSLAATNDIIQSGESYFLIGKSRGIICYAAVLNFKEGTVSWKIAKQLFPSGITHFILANTKGQPLNERLVFIDHHDNLNIETIAAKSDYTTRDSIAVRIAVTDNAGKPVAGNFSMAVTDDMQAKPDTLNNENILTRMLLTADLKGFIEGPEYYLQTKTNEAWQALDNLLLTQGWVRYDWQVDKEHPAFAAENEFEVNGQVQNGFNKLVKATHVTLLSKSPLLAKDTLTDNDGRFVFRNFPEVDTPAFVIKAVNRHDKSFNVGIVMDDDKPPLFAMLAGPEMQLWYLSNDTALFNTAKNNRIRIEQEYLAPNGHLLNEVKITGQKIVKGSQNLNGPGNADLVLDEADMIKARKQNWLDMFNGKIKDFHMGRSNYYYVDGDPALFIVDGIFLNPWLALVYPPTSFQDYVDNLTHYFQSHNAEDIKGIEVMVSSKYYGDYKRRYVGPGDPTIYSFIEITTRSGRGPAMIENTPGIYIYRPLALNWPKQFYKPRYTVNDTTKHLPDTRSTIDWEPNILTNKNGEATISFYAVDKPATYTIIIEGSDGNGNLGYKMERITVVKPKPDTKL